MRYDPGRAPDPARWIALPEDERIEMVERHHRRQNIRLPRPTVHAVMHVIVENQIALGETPVVEAIPRLMGEGLSRHDALHAVAWVLAMHMRDVATSGEEFATDAYYSEVRELTKERWYAEAGQE
jgi:uncharacterized protein YoaH (UPF0181 family)